jgi:hypothetical protein
MLDIEFEVQSQFVANTFTFILRHVPTVYMYEDRSFVKNALFWGMMTCRLVENYRRFGGTYHRSLQEL